MEDAVTTPDAGVIPCVAAPVVLPPRKLVAVCPSVQRLDLVKQLAQSFFENKPADLDAALCVAALGPDDGTSEWCASRGIGVMRSEAVVPFAKAVNMTVAHIEDYDWLLLINNDVIIQPGYFEALREAIAVGYEIIGSKLLYPNGTIQHFGKWFTLDFYPFHVLRGQPATHEQAQQPRTVPAVTFAAVAIKREVWQGVGGLDESYTNGYEDDAFCLTAREQGAQIGVHPGMLATHLESQSTGQDTPNKQAMWRLFKEKWVYSGRIQWALGMLNGWRESA